MGKLNGADLNRIFGLNAKNAHYGEWGNYYDLLTDFPGILFDANGYIIFNTKEDYENCPYLHRKRKLNIPAGISNIPDYRRVTENNTLLELSQSIHGKVGKNYIVDGDKTDVVIPDQVAVNIAERVAQQIMRIIRDTNLSRLVKSLYEGKCQICQTSLVISKSGQIYAEGHHIKPLGAPHNGPDVLENILCVCPNHHVQLDYKSIELNLDNLHFHKLHHISAEYIEYHNRLFKLHQADDY